MTEKLSSSKAQQIAEQVMLRVLEQQLSTEQTVIRFEKPNPSHWILKLDGYCAEPLIFVEAWARIGTPSSSQKDKVMSDLLKMGTAEWHAGRPARKILAVICDKAVNFLRGKTWYRDSANQQGIEVITVEVPEAIKEQVRLAQKNQAKGNIKADIEPLLP